MQPKSKLLRPHDRFLLSLQLVDIPIRPNSLPVRELGLVARSPHHEVCRKADYDPVSVGYFPAIQSKGLMRSQHSLIALTVIVRNPRPSLLTQCLIAHTRLDSPRMHTQHKQPRVLVVQLLVHFSSSQLRSGVARHARHGWHLNHGGAGVQDDRILGSVGQESAQQVESPLDVDFEATVPVFGVRVEDSPV